MTSDVTRPYLCIPKLIEQPTWGGDYIVNFKSWSGDKKLRQLKIGQAYELFQGSNLSLLTTSSDPQFSGEICLSGMVNELSVPSNSYPLAQFINEQPEAVLGKSLVEKYGKWMPLLIKFTQSLGNSFQIHIKDPSADGQAAANTKWKSKPESWYYFEPGITTLGVKSGTNWSDYEKSLTELNTQIISLGEQVKQNQIPYQTAQEKIQQCIKQYNPYQYVNLVEVKKDELLDLSPCGIHHSWEEDSLRYHWGNVLYELQVNIPDEDATIRSYDKGKMSPEGKTRPLQIADYFQFIDRSEDANNPGCYLRVPKPLKVSKTYKHYRLLQTPYYTLEKVVLKTPARLTEKIDRFRHIFVKSGTIEVFTSHQSLLVTCGHSCFVPAGAQEYGLKNVTPESTILISY